MNVERCPREDELLDALGRGYVGAELGAHVTDCIPCTELNTVAGELLRDRTAAIMEAPVPSAGTMLWRIRVRQRQEAESAARRSLLIGQAVTLLVAFGLVMSFFGSHLTFAVRDLVATIRLSTPLLLAFATWALIAPIAGWLAIRQK